MLPAEPSTRKPHATPRPRLRLCLILKRVPDGEAVVNLDRAAKILEHFCGLRLLQIKPAPAEGVQQ